MTMYLRIAGILGTMLLAIACGREEPAACGSRADCGAGQSCVNKRCVDTPGGRSDPYAPATREEDPYWDVARTVDGDIPACDDDNPCTLDRYDGSECVYDPIEGIACNDGNPGTMSDMCHDGQCTGIAYSCDDGRACTADVPLGDGTCLNTLQSGFCIIDGGCVAAGTSDPHNSCQSCDPDTNPAGWTAAAPGSLCDDGLRLTIDDRCDADAVCTGTPVDCLGQADCDDGLACNGEELCQNNQCVNGEAPVCDGNFACTEPAGTCACLPPFYTADDQCLAPTTFATLEYRNLPPESFDNGADAPGGFADGPAWLTNTYDPEYGSWDGFALSSITDNITPGWGNQYSAIPGAGAQGSPTYAVAYVSDYATQPVSIALTDAGETGYTLAGMYVTNSSYAYFSMLNGDAYAKKFGGDDGTDPDWFLLEIIGIGPGGDETGRVAFYLADFRSGNSEDDYIVDDWAWVNLDSLGDISALSFALSSSDNSDWGMNTPSYFALDTIVRRSAGASMDDNHLLAQEEYYNGADMAGGFVSGSLHFSVNYSEEYGSWDGFAASRMTDTVTPGWGNQYSAITGGGVDDDAYAVAFVGDFAVGPGIVTLMDAPEGRRVSGMYITNDTYTYYSMRDGDDYAKKFGGDDGTDPDWLLLDIIGIGPDGTETGRVAFYLADFRAENSADDYIVDDWTWVDLDSLGDISALSFTLSSSDNGDWGMNTPAYFALDNVDMPVDLKK